MQSFAGTLHCQKLFYNIYTPSHFPKYPTDWTKFKKNGPWTSRPLGSHSSGSQLNQMQGRTLLAINTDKSSLITAMEWVCASGKPSPSLWTMFTTRRGPPMGSGGFYRRPLVVGENWEGRLCRFKVQIQEGRFSMVPSMRSWLWGHVHEETVNMVCGCTGACWPWCIYFTSNRMNSIENQVAVGQVMPRCPIP